MTSDVRSERNLVGKGRGGASDWIAVRLNSFAVLGLFAWLLTALFLLPNFSYESVREWLGHPLNSVLMVLLVVMTFWHSHYGIKEVIDDYVHRPFGQAVSMAALYTFTIFGGAFAVWAVLRVALTAG
jgi:succinate dehydrogenase / fumarate reductase, membrane anchor subunit